MLIAWGVAAALAAPDCEPLDQAVFLRGLDKVDVAFRAGDRSRADALLEVLHQRAPCLVETVSPGTMARYAVLQALSASMEQDHAWVERWSRAAVWADPDHDWPDYVGPTHPVRTVEISPDDLVASGPEEQGLAPPLGGGLVLSGVLLARPVVPSEVPVLRQVFDPYGRIVEAGWQDGGRFPTTWLSDDPAPVSPPVWWGGAPPAQVVSEDPPWTWATVVALAGAGANTQRVEDGGTFLQDGKRSGALIGAATTGMWVPSTVGGAWDVAIAPAGGWGELSARAALGVKVGPVVAVAGAGAIAASVVEGSEARTVWVPMPHVGVVSRIPAGLPWLELAAGGGWVPAATHGTARIAIAGGPGTSWTAGLDVGVLTTRFTQPDSSMGLTVTRVRGGVRVGAVFGP